MTDHLPHPLGIGKGAGDLLQYVESPSRAKRQTQRYVSSTYFQHWLKILSKLVRKQMGSSLTWAPWVLLPWSMSRFNLVLQLKESSVNRSQWGDFFLVCFQFTLCFQFFSVISVFYKTRPREYLKESTLILIFLWWSPSNDRKSTATVTNEGLL